MTTEDAVSATTQTTNAGGHRPTLAQIGGGLIRRYLSGRRRWIALAVGILAAGTWLNWGWLVAAGVAPLIVAFAPCAAMCALGLCMSRMGGRSCSNDAKTGAGAASEPNTDVPNSEAKPAAIRSAPE
jgi:hypothetical protein